MRSHSWQEDLFALISSVALISLGIVLFKQAGLVVGGTMGLALLLQKTTSLSFGTWFFMINLPFYLIGFKKMGKVFVLKTMLVVGIISICGDYMSRLVRIEQLNPVYAAIVGGLLVGIGLMILFRHKASMGGFNIFCLWMQERYGFSAGKIQMMMDCSVVIGSAFVSTPIVLMVSVLSAVMINLVLSMNHKPGRYSPATA